MGRDDGRGRIVDAKRFLPHIPQSQFAAQALTVALYLEGGIRAVEIGSVMFAQKDAATGTVKYPTLELVRLTVPRHVYTQSHLDYVAEVILKVHERRASVRGLGMVYEQPRLRHFTRGLRWCDTANRIVISYASTCGSMREVAEYIGKALREAGGVVDVRGA